MTARIAACLCVRRDGGVYATLKGLELEPDPLMGPAFSGQLFDG
jgi:hypothetical protein